MLKLIPKKNLSTGVGQNYDFQFFAVFIWNCAFHLMFVVPQTWVFISVTLNGLKFDMLMYPDHLQDWLVSDHLLLISLFWRHFNLVKQAKFATSGHFQKNAVEESSEL